MLPVSGNAVSWIEIYMKKYFYLLFVLFLIVNSCKEDSNILTPIDSDIELQKQLLGTWVSQYNSQTTVYHSNSTFIDSVFGAVDSIRYDLLYVIEGNYKIKDSLLIKSEIKIKYVLSGLISNNGLLLGFTTKYLKFNNNKFTEYAVDAFDTCDGSVNDKIWGNWSRIVWICDSSLTNPTYIGRIKVKYVLNKALNKATWWSESLDGNYFSFPDSSISNSVNYNHPYLDLYGRGDDIIFVQFKNNRMFWWYDYEPYSFYRKN